jgi:hypothetical protein
MSVHLEGLEFQRREAANKMRSLVSVAETRADGVMLASEQRQFDALSSEIDRLDAAILTAGAERRDDFARRNADATERASGVTDFNRQYGPATGGTGLSGAYVGRESGPYTPDSAANGGNSWVRDMAHARRGNGAAIERLSRNDQHARTYSTRAALSSVTGTGGEFIPPLWLEEQFVKFVRPGRPAWELTSQNALPPGTDSLNIPKINTGTAVALQGFPTGG